LLSKTESLLPVGWMRATAILISALILPVSGGLGAPTAQAAAPFELVYRISHSLVGELGSYTCTVEPLGQGSIEIRSREHIDARMLGIPVYRMDAANTERWQGDRLLSFRAVTEQAGERTEISGRAEGDRFVITSPQGQLAAAANVHPAEPCAADFVQSTTILRPDTGGLEQVRVSGGEATSISLNGAAVPVKKYVLDGNTRYTVWLDWRNLPVKFVIDDGNGRATFTLAKCVSCDLGLSRLGFE
jgi:hypothetical protein